ncbi:UDP-glucose 6-dehydrogenase TuaD [Calidithermus terrae]|uniref:UDP-glucose 6-dehydrogenase n=1 Tax=Calidithermus terrae TaxID=1408545 RepID=A0A399ETI4_9DEIN|nr:UDP-glucose/GDP-mannose dehydrogenase family protein [Calidithermus terrae]RIH87288.1 UDP-glucose 6-dehydrogenase TuaD [Calidithermus terrae]
MENAKTVTVVGAGYVGLSTAVALALLGHEVRVLDTNAARVEGLKRGEPPFYEPGLAESLAQAAPRLRYTTDPAEAYGGSEVAVVAVGTPPTPAGHADLRYLYQALETLAQHRVGLVVVKSTVPVGTNQDAKRILGPGVAVASNPEFLRQGQALSDTLYPDRILVGAEEEWVFGVLERLYQPLVEQSFEELPWLPRPKALREAVARGYRVPLVRTGLESAELAKYAANAFLATRISFINEIANVAEAVGADIEEVVRAIGLDPRIGPHFLKAGLGYGGSCFPKDTRALAYLAKRGGYDFKLLRAVIEVNQAQRYRLVEKAEAVLGRLTGQTVVLLGLAFKPGTDDLRDAPSLEIAEELLARGARVRATDPKALELAKQILDPRVETFADPLEALEGADAVLLVTEWPEYRALDWAEVKRRLRRPVVLDGRNALDPRAMEALGYVYQGIGRGRKLSELAL